MDHELFFVDLFCGGGGSARGYVDEGFTPVLGIDNAVHTTLTYKENFPHALVWQKDLRYLRSEDIQLVLPKNKQLPLLIASPPCEPFTSANKKRKQNPQDRFYLDPVGHLMLDTIRLIGDLEPIFFVIENVVPSVEKENREIIKDELERVGVDKVYFNIVQATEWGVPSHRLRVFISNLKFPSIRVRPKTVAEAIFDLPDPRFPNPYDSHFYVAPPAAYLSKITSLRTNQAIVYFQGATRELRNYIRLHEEYPAPVIMGKGRYIHPIDDRLLTVREHARLMSFPDHHMFKGSVDERYDLAGEAVPPQITKIIAKEIKKKIHSLT